jgi:hypothetical protein
MRHALFTLLAVGALAGSAAAQPAAAPAPAGSSFGIRGFAAIDLTTAASAKSFDAIFDSSHTTGFGGGVEVDVWQHLFVRVAATHAQRTGARVFVDDAGDVFPLNIPLTVTMTPIEAGAGWRFVGKSRVTPYIGGAFVSLGYQETSDFAQGTDNVNERYSGGEGFGGVEFAIGKGLFVGGEAQYRHVGVPDVSSSVMHQFGDKDLGGFTGRLLVGFGTK